MTAKSIDQHIESTPGICGGRPRIAGHRITVEQIAIWHDRMGLNADEIADEYNLSLADIYAALAFYFDHREKIDEDIAASANWIDELKSQTPSLIAKKLGRADVNG